jgi:TonB family protein
LSADAPILNAEQIKQFVLFAPKPYYPSRARREYKTGAGVFLLNIDQQTGRVASIKIEKTTGLWSLDVSCLKALIRWRFKPTRLARYEYRSDL